MQQDMYNGRGRGGGRNWMGGKRGEDSAPED